MKRIAIVTGASSGVGRRFAETAAKRVDFDELWIVARRMDLLRGRDISTFGFVARAQIALVKLLPHRIVMHVWCRQQHI